MPRTRKNTRFVNTVVSTSHTRHKPKASGSRRRRRMSHKIKLKKRRVSGGRKRINSRVKRYARKRYGGDEFLDDIKNNYADICNNAIVDAFCIFSKLTAQDDTNQTDTFKLFCEYEKDNICTIICNKFKQDGINSMEQLKKKKKNKWFPINNTELQQLFRQFKDKQNRQRDALNQYKEERDEQQRLRKEAQQREQEHQREEEQQREQAKQREQAEQREQERLREQEQQQKKRTELLQFLTKKTSNDDYFAELTRRIDENNKNFSDSNVDMDNFFHQSTENQIMAKLNSAKTFVRTMIQLIKNTYKNDIEIQEAYKTYCTHNPDIN